MSRLCPVSAFQAWKDTPGLEVGAVFRSIDRLGNTGDSALSANSLIPLLRGLFQKPRISSARTYNSHSLSRNSPAFSVRPCKTPIWITWGGAETTEFARQSEIYHQAWLAAGNAAELQAVPDANHFTVIAGFESADSAVCRWLAGKLQS